MKSLSSKLYDKDYYLNTCCGSEEFKKYKGKNVHSQIKEYVNLLDINKSKKVLDIGCGRGDLAFQIAKKGATVYGIDYSKDGIALAIDALNLQSEEIKNKLDFKIMDAKNIQFKDNTFDIITAIDVFEHLYKSELDIVMNEIYRVLKPNGILLVHTDTNKIYLDFTHKYWSYPISYLLLNINKAMTGKVYLGLEKDPRNEFHKKQHVNEPTYKYLKTLFKNHKFKGEITSRIPYKPLVSWKDLMYNITVLLYPLSNYRPLKSLFEADYLCVMHPEKS